MNKVWIALLCLQFIGCAVTTEEPPVTEKSQQLWQQRLQKMTAVSDWDMSARTVFFDHDEAFNLTIHWVQTAQDFDMTLEAPFGQGTFKLQSIESETSDNRVRLILPDQTRYYRASATQVLADVLGWSIPLNGLTNWIKGIPHQQSSFTPEIDFAGRLKTLQQDGWWINYLQYEQSNIEMLKNYKIPSQIYLKKDEYALKLVIDRWASETLQTDTDELFPAF